MEMSPLSHSYETELQSNNAKNREICQKHCSFYQSKFPDVIYLSSSDLVELHRKGESVILVDVRTKPERQVSMLQGAMTHEQFLQSPPPDDSSLLVTYCTVGYRSGLEARRFALLFPEWKNRIRSLDGFVSYTHALGEALEQNETTAAPPKLVDPSTGQVTNQVHTFGRMWGYIDEHHFEATHFSIFELFLRMMQVMVAVITCTILRIQTICSPRRRALLDE